VLATKTAISSDGGGGGDDADNEEGSSFFAGVPNAAPSGFSLTTPSGSKGDRVDESGASSEADKNKKEKSSSSSSSENSSSEPVGGGKTFSEEFSDLFEAWEILSSVAGWAYEASRVPAVINFLRFGKTGKKRETRRDKLQKLREAVAETSSSPSAFVDLLEELNRGGDHDEVISLASDPFRAPNPLPEEAAAAYLEALVSSGRLRGDYILPRGAPAGSALLPARGNAHASLPVLLSDLSGRVAGGSRKGESGKAAKVPLPGRSPSRPIHVAVYSPLPLSGSSSSSSLSSAAAAASRAAASSAAAGEASSVGASIVQSVARTVATLFCLGALFVVGAGVARRQAFSAWQQQQQQQQHSISSSSSSQQQQSSSSSSNQGQNPNQNPFGNSNSNNPLAGSSNSPSSAGYAPKEYNGEDVPEQSKVKFDDVKGVDEAKAELAEVVDFLKSPQKFKNLAAKLPKGVLLTGPPGTGKTLLARAVAGEAGVPFFFRAGSEFEEMFVGVGARRARALFAAAKKAAPCIVFIDEIDAVGGNRRAWENHSRKTLNQLLVEMDGFEPTEGVIVIAATNAADTLDPALVRPGRFDRQVAVPLPDVRGRLEILMHYLKSKPLARDEAEAAERAAENARREAAAEAMTGAGASASANSHPNAAGGGGRLIPSLQQGSQQQSQQQQQQQWGRGSIFGPQSGSNGAFSPSSTSTSITTMTTTTAAAAAAAAPSSPLPPPPPIQTVDLPLLAGTLARRTPGFSGAQLASMVNEAALLAARRELGAITPALLDEARDKVLMGSERRSLVQSAVNRRLTAYHEAGHALVASLTRGARPIHKATIMPRGHALGMVSQLPDGDDTSVSRLQLRAEVDVALGGMAAENLVFGVDGVTTGARSDLKQATRVARHMIAECGEWGCWLLF